MVAKFTLQSFVKHLQNSFLEKRQLKFKRCTGLFIAAEVYLLHAPQEAVLLHVSLRR